MESAGLVFEDGGVPAAGEKRRVGAKEQAVCAEDGERFVEDAAEVEVAILVADPVIGAGGVEEDVGAEVGHHEGFAKIAGAEMGDDKGEARMTHGEGMDIDGVGEAEIEL